MHIQSLEPRRLFTAFSGFVYSDANGNGKVDPVEGLAGCVVTFNNNLDHSVSTPVTAADGSFSTDILPGSWHLNIDGPTVATPYNHDIIVGFSPITQNFALATDGHVTPPPTTTKPDVAVTISQIPSLLTVGGRPAPVTVTVTNTGAAYTGPLTADLYFSKNKTIEPSDYHVQPALSFPTISIGKTSTKTFKFDASLLASVVPIVAGKFYLLTRITIDHDANTANNTTATTTAASITRAAANLVPTFRSNPTAKGKTASFTLVIKNAGSATATGPATLTLSAQPTKGGKAIALPTLTLAALKLAAGASTKPLKLTADLKALTAGSYKLVATLSATLTTAESNTKDNKITSVAFTVK